MLAPLQPHRVASLNPVAPSRASYRTKQSAEFNIAARLQNFSLLAWAVPAQRLARLLPASFQLEETLTEGRQMAWVSVASCIDDGVEQTAYRLHIRRRGEPAHWLLGISLGALSAVAKRNLWSMPWHLSAMELAERQGTLALRTQSQWANANWQLRLPTTAPGEMVHLETISDLPASLAQSTFNQYFQRRDGALGWRRIKLLQPHFAQVTVQTADCDRLRRLGILTADELARPRLALWQDELPVQLSAPSLLESPTEGALRRAA